MLAEASLAKLTLVGGTWVSLFGSMGVLREKLDVASEGGGGFVVQNSTYLMVGRLFRSQRL